MFVAVQPGLCRTCSETQIVGFIKGRLICVSGPDDASNFLMELSGFLREYGELPLFLILKNLICIDLI